MLRALTAFYDKGRKPCLLKRLCASVDADAFRTPLKEVFLAWFGAVQRLCEEAGAPRAVAKERAEDAVVRVEGALILGGGLSDVSVFARTVARLRRTLFMLE